MKARLIAFPVKGRTWCFSRCIDQFRSNSAQSQSSSTTPSTFRDLYKSLSSDSKPISANAELVVDFVSSKILRPSKELEELIRRGNTDTGLGKSILIDICKTFNLNPQQILKYQKL